MRLGLALAGLGLTFSAQVAQAQPGAPVVVNRPLSMILKSVEDASARQVFSAELRRGVWEVVSCEGRAMICREDKIDAATGRVMRSEREMVVDRRPPAQAKPASAIARAIEKAGLGDIRELEWDTRVWEAKLRNANGRAELNIDPMTGAVRRCEGPGCRR